MSKAVGTYQMPEHGWTCFHCGETFTTVGGARDHFGADEGRTPGCLLKVELGGERGLLMALRRCEDVLARFQAEDSDVLRFANQQQARHSEALRNAEEAGYARGLRDGQMLAPASPKQDAAVPHDDCEFAAVRKIWSRCKDKSPDWVKGFLENFAQDAAKEDRNG